MSPRQSSDKSLSKRDPASKRKIMKTVKHPKGHVKEFNTQSLSHEQVIRALNKFSNFVRLNIEPMATRSPPSLLLGQRHIPSIHSTGSHRVHGGTLRKCKMVTIGNTSDFDEWSPNLNGHVFSGLRILRSKNVHIGNTGPGSEGHNITNPDVEGADALQMGDFRSMNVKDEAFRRANEIARA